MYSKTRLGLKVKRLGGPKDLSGPAEAGRLGVIWTRLGVNLGVRVLVHTKTVHPDGAKYGASRGIHQDGKYTKTTPRLHQDSTQIYSGNSMCQGSTLE